MSERAPANTTADEFAAPPATVTLTAIRESPRAPGRYQLLLSDGRKFTVALAAISELGLTRTGMVLDAFAVERLVRESVLSTLVARAVAMLARARRTRRELERRLQRIEADHALVAEAMRRLDAHGVPDDAEVARAEASARLRKGEGPARIRQEMRRKGLDAETTSQALRVAIDDEDFDERAACHHAAERRYRALQKLERSVARRRLTAFLMRRGYASATIQQVIRELMAEHH